jgi:hypothetical protein
MTTEAEKGKPSETKAKKVTFKCKFCGKSRPLEEMVVLTAYFPPLIACRECEKKIR